MAQTLVPQKFSEVASAEVLKHQWAQLVPDSQACLVTTVQFGEQIADQDGFTFLGKATADTLKGHIGFIVSGTAELLEESVFEETYYAYRPIRLLEVGSLIGDFSVVDKSLGVKGASRPGETWRIVAGRRSLIVASKVDQEVVKLKFSHESYPGRRRPHNFLTATCKTQTRIAFFKSEGLFSKGTPFFHELLCSAWNRARTYRTGINSYNFQTMLNFRQTVIEESTAVTQKGHHTPQTYTKELLSIFSDALYDALNRPIRAEPVFAAVPDAFPATCMKAFKDLKIPDAAILTAAHASVSPVFYYPLDLHNYFINAYCQVSELGTTSKVVFGWSRESAPKKKRAREFYHETADRVLQEFLRKETTYQYSVKCEDIDQLDGKVLMLKFSKRQ